MRNRVLLLAALTVGVIVLLGAPVLAFHDDGVAHCNGCHTMHNSQDGVAMNYNAAGTGPGGFPGEGYTDLLLFQNKNDVCLRCHAGLNSYHVWADDVMVPGDEHGAGNFVFLEEDNINDAHAGGAGNCDVATCGPGDDEACTDYYECTDPLEGGVWTWTNAIPGQAAGHTLASGIKGTVTDTTLSAAPGGVFLSTDLNCASCHDPHGNDTFRLLYQAGQSYNKDSGGSFTFPAGATIDADGINLFFPGVETDTNHNAYYDGYSAWCGSCHLDLHDNSSALIHPSGEFLDTDQIASYNAYEGSTDCANNDPAGGNPCGSGLQADAYLAVVPFEDANSTGIGSTLGAAATSKVACMSCHRAHASSAPDAGRWDFNVTGVEEDGHESASYKIPNPYPLDTSQRSLCNKCHSQDEYDAVINFTP